MTPLLQSIESALLSDCSVCFKREFGGLLIQVINNENKKFDTQRLPMDDRHFDEERISDCIKFQTNKVTSNE